MLPVGNPAIGDDFIDREKEIDQILSALGKDSVLPVIPVPSTLSTPNCL